MLKQTFITLCLILSAIGCWAQKVWKEPSQFFQNNYICYPTIEEIEFKQEETILHIRVEYISGQKISFQESTVLIDQDGKKYAIKSAEPTRSNEEPCELGWETTIPQKGYGDYALHFEPLPETTERIQFIENYHNDGFKIWNITESDYKPKVKDNLFDSNWRNAQTGDWILGLYANNAVYDCKVWSYEEKSDKKITLTDGQRHLTITIGKEKNGTRQFVIDGKELTLSKFSNGLPAYPTTDNTAFSTEMKQGEATITGIIKDFPHEIGDLKKSLKFISMNAIIDTRGKDNLKIDIPIDSTGVFSVKVPVYGTSQILMWPSVNNCVICSSTIVVEPGKTYFMVQDWSRNTSLFMGDGARLMNELYAFNALVPFTFTSQNHVLNPDIIVSFKDKCMKKLDLANAKLANMIANNPTLSKRYRDFTNEYNQKATAEYIIMSHIAAPEYTLPSEVVEAVNKIAEINTSLPLSLTQSLSNYLYTKEFYEKSQMRHRYEATPDVYLSFEKKGLIKLSDEDRTLLAKWQERSKAMDEANKLTGKDRHDAFTKIIEEHIGYDLINQFKERPDIKDAYDQWVPSNARMIEIIADSLYTDNNLRDFFKARALVHLLSEEKKPLDDEGLALLDKIGNSDYKAQINEFQEPFKKEMEEKGMRANAVIHPASDAKGLTDGKAIMDKLVAPYKGKIVYVDLWGVGCGGCMTSLEYHSPALKEAVKDYDIVFLYLVTEKNEDRWKYYISEFNLTGKNEVHYNLPSSQFSAIGKYIKNSGIPTYLLYDKQGNMEVLDRNHVVNPQGFRKKIEEVSL